MMMLKQPLKICILGGGFGGLYTAFSLSRYSWGKIDQPEITLVDQSDRFVFTPLLYELVTEEIQKWHISPSFEKLLKHTEIRFVRGKIEGVDLEKRQVYLQGQKTLDYDRLAIAVGVQTRMKSVPGAKEHAIPYKNLADVERLMERLRTLEASDKSIIRVAIAGGGPSGIELACKIADRLQERGQLLLIERNHNILKNFNSFVRETSKKALDKRNIRVELDTQIERVGSDAIALLRHGKPHAIPADLVVWTIGTCTSDWIATIDGPQNQKGQLIAQPTLQLKNYPEVFVLGDVAHIADAKGENVPTTAQAAFQQAKIAARNIWASVKKRPLLVYRYRHLGDMLALGIEDGIISCCGIYGSGKVANFIRSWIYLLKMPTFHHSLEVGCDWLAAGIKRPFSKMWKWSMGLFDRERDRRTTRLKRRKTLFVRQQDEVNYQADSEV